MARTVAKDTPAAQLAAADRSWREVRRDSTSSPTRIVDAAVDLVIAARLAGRYVEALHVGKEAADVLLRTAPGRLALVEAHVCLSCLDAGELADAERCFQAARSRPTDKGDDETHAALCRAEGNLHLARRRWAEAVEAFRRGLDRTRDPLERTIALYNMGEANIRLRRFADARRLFEEAIVEKERLADRWGLSYSYWGVGVCRLEEGDARAALVAVERGLEQVSTLADPKITSRLTALRARCLAALGKLDEAEQRARDAVRESTRAALPRERADAQLVLGEVLLHVGQGRRAQAAAEQALEIAKKGGVHELEEAARALLERAGQLRSAEGAPVLDPPPPRRKT